MWYNMELLSSIFKKKDIMKEMKKYNNHLSIMDCYMCNKCDSVPCYMIIPRSSIHNEPDEFKEILKRYMDILNGKSDQNNKLPSRCPITSLDPNWTLIDYNIVLDQTKEFYEKTNVTKTGLKGESGSQEKPKKPSRFSDINVV